ncbi:MAG: phospholipase D-like domain-containing protein [Verrucomicrobiales bacterium]|jgi:cardiolipin synthase A/B|nr:phospholipase D-like domain-containing protein [Verrucomicrobiales bacterium]
MTGIYLSILQALAISLLLSSCASRQLTTSTGTQTAISSTRFPAAFAQAAQAEWVARNEITTLINGDAYYPPMLKAIEGARNSITFETFAYVDGPITRTFTRALAKKARQGIPVLMIVDDVGSRHVGEHNEALLRDAGVHYHTYHPFNPLRLFRYNNRTHRKILVVDGKEAFTGGAGFALAWEGNAHSPEHWRDTQYGLTGPAVAQLQHAFAENWKELTGQVLAGPTYFPALTATGPYLAQFVYDSPQTPSNPIAHTFLHGINSARESLVLEQSYFVPNKTFREAIIAAAQRGVTVEMLVPSDKIDSPFCRYASQNSWKALLEAGVRLYQYTPTMMHGKLMIADGQLSIIGSGNMDDRSFYINDEVNLHVLSSSFAKEQLAMYQRDLKQAEEITLTNLSDILAPLPHRLLARLVAPQL